jgi:hypothetical protein
MLTHADAAAALQLRLEMRRLPPHKKKKHSAF